MVPTTAFRPAARPESACQLIPIVAHEPRLDRQSSLGAPTKLVPLDCAEESVHRGRAEIDHLLPISCRMRGASRARNGRGSGMLASSSELVTPWTSLDPLSPIWAASSVLWSACPCWDICFWQLLAPRRHFGTCQRSRKPRRSPRRSRY